MLLPALRAGGAQARGPSLHWDWLALPQPISSPLVCEPLSAPGPTCQDLLPGWVQQLLLGSSASILPTTPSVVLHQSRGSFQNQVTFLPRSTLLRGPQDLQDLARAFLSAFTLHPPPPHSWVQPQWLLWAFCWRIMALSLPQDLCACASAQSPLLPALGLPCSLTSLRA